MALQPFFICKRKVKKITGYLAGPGNEFGADAMSLDDKKADVTTGPVDGLCNLFFVGFAAATEGFQINDGHI